ncbi:MAG: hypothetical protein ACUVYA_13390 [Planctomycetota bacterium]
MSRWLLKRWRAWRRAWSSARAPRGVPAAAGEAVLAVLAPSGTESSPPLATVFRASRSYRGVADVEIRGFLDGDVKFERNVATQYHVRIGCEGSKPVRGRYEVMRLLERWDVSALPREARVHSVRLIHLQENCSAFPHRYPLRWPADFYLYEVKRPWGPGRGGVGRDNQSSPERGDAWWLEAAAGESAWRIPGCGYASDDDPDADRAAEPLAWCRLRSPDEPLVFSGPRLARHLEEVVRGGRALDLLVKASEADEEQPGSVKTFFSAEYGDDWNPELRPRLEVVWSAPSVAWVREPFCLEPGTEVALPSPDFGAVRDPELVLAVSLELEDPERCGPSLVPEVRVSGWRSPAVRGDPRAVPLDLPIRGLPEKGFRAVVSAAIHPVGAGEAVTLRILETWAPEVTSPEALAVTFRFTAPSGRILDVRARHAGGYEYIADFRPDELGVWAYAWRTRPDLRFEEQRGSGRFTVIRGPGTEHFEAIRTMAEAALRDARSSAGRILSRRRNHARLTALGRELREMLAEAQARGTSIHEINEVRELARRVGEILPLVE